jgi:hypothetical protein
MSATNRISQDKIPYLTMKFQKKQGLIITSSFPTKLLISSDFEWAEKCSLNKHIPFFTLLKQQGLKEILSNKDTGILILKGWEWEKKNTYRYLWHISFHQCDHTFNKKLP